MNTSGDAAEQVVRLSLEGFEVAARLTGSAAKNVAILLAAALREKGKTTGKARLTSMIRSGKRLKVFSIPQKDLKKFTEHAKKYGVLYTVLKNRRSRDGNAPVDIIAREEDASKIQRIVDRFQIGKVDKAQIVAEARRERADSGISREMERGRPAQEAVREEKVPFAEKAGSVPLSGPVFGTPDSELRPVRSAVQISRPSVKEKLDRMKAQDRAEQKKRQIRQHTGQIQSRAGQKMIRKGRSGNDRKL